MYLDVGDGHQIYYEIHGSKEPKATAVVLHGGPGGGLQRSQLKHFDLKKWRVILFDQRGCGKSTPFLRLYKNTTWDLVQDIEKLREHVGVTKWAVFGGSWGSTLSLAYASKHIQHISALILRGIYTAEKWENHWLMSPDGAARLYPDKWAAVERMARKGRGRTMTQRFMSLLYRKKTQKAAAATWWGWEHAVSYLKPRPDDTSAKDGLAISALEAHYFNHNCWIKSGQLLRAAAKIPKSVPVHIIQGRYDLVCPPAAAWRLHQAVPHSHITFTMAGHAGSEPPTAAALRAATDSLVVH